MPAVTRKGTSVLHPPSAYNLSPHVSPGSRLEETKSTSIKMGFPQDCRTEQEPGPRTAAFHLDPTLCQEGPARRALRAPPTLSQQDATGSIF